jgi:copper homeostasis protein
MRKLEVIVTSAAEARVAAAAGADRLELVRDLNTGGLTPEWEVIREVIAAVGIPVRVMLRENASMAVADAAELKALQTKAAQIHALPINGLVMGWVTSDGAWMWPRSQQSWLTPGNARSPFIAPLSI